ncbi:NgoMIV restriction enzyme [Actinomadura hallensis]|uniref:NgoMIV restriction enzyme n=1 Tax=Actinomadura hallensis TaxID=337895 RepID=A0A543I8C3_9ACTN|nr:NgoMIV family type II restriction endonuclease [Actinomadura hallensis]TQM66852.1 NgoMIV restriction enzyme [Actinomadura hallensis]
MVDMGSNAEFAATLLGWRLGNKQRLVPNTADTSNPASIAIAGTLLDKLGIPRGIQTGTADPRSGRPLEKAVAESLRQDLPLHDSGRAWHVHEAPISISEFVQYRHLKELDKLVRNNKDLRVTLGRDYLIKPDVIVALPGRSRLEPEFLHAAVSCKWTIRSDRVQNIRHENNQMIRHRRERLPHLVTVTAEPLPTRLSAIARGTGELDAVYHIAYAALDAAVHDLASRGRIEPNQFEAWLECKDLGRVRPFTDLAKTIALW